MRDELRSELSGPSAADRWGYNRTEAPLRSVELARALDDGVREVLARDDLTPAQKRGIAASLSVAGSDEVDVTEAVSVEK